MENKTIKKIIIWTSFSHQLLYIHQNLDGNFRLLLLRISFKFFIFIFSPFLSLFLSVLLSVCLNLNWIHKVLPISADFLFVFSLSLYFAHFSISVTVSHHLFSEFYAWKCEWLLFSVCHFHSLNAIINTNTNNDNDKSRNSRSRKRNAYQDESTLTTKAITNEEGEENRQKKMGKANTSIKIRKCERIRAVTGK